MKDLTNYIDEATRSSHYNTTDESLRSIFKSGLQFDSRNPKHMQLYDSFIRWFKGAVNKFDEDLVIDMIRNAEEDIVLGQV